MTECSVAVLFFTLCLIANFSQIHCLGISSKLDFGDDEITTKTSVSAASLPSAALVKTLVNLSHSVKTNHGGSSSGGAISGVHRPGTFDFKTISLPKSSGATDKKESKTDFGEIGVICTTGNCNGNNKEHKSGGDTISTDIHVHVETNINKGSATNQSASLEGDDDVPIIVGYGGTSGHEDSAPLKPDYHRPKPDYTTSGYKPKPENTLNPEALVISTLDPSFQFNRRVEGIPGVISIVDSNLAETPQLNGASKVHILPPEYNYGSNDAKFKPNGIELQISYFNPAFNNHYFGENAPPQYVWYPKHGSTFNPHSFKVNTNPTYTYSTFVTVKPTPAAHHGSYGFNSQTCTCSNPGLHWYPSQTWKPHQPPGSTINDKLNFNDRS